MWSAAQEVWPNRVFGLGAPCLAQQAADGAAKRLHAPLKDTRLLLNAYTAAYTMQPLVAG